MCNDGASSPVWWTLPLTFQLLTYYVYVYHFDR